MYDAKVQHDVILTGISKQYEQDNPKGFMAEKLFPSKGVDLQSAKYDVWPAIGASEPAYDVRAAGTVANEIQGAQRSEDAYYATEFALQVPVTDEERDNHTGDSKIKPDTIATKTVTGRILLGREIRMFKMATDATKFANGLTKTLSGAGQWSGDTSDPRGDALAAMAAVHEKVGITPDSVVLGYKVYKRLLNHPKVLAMLGNAKDRFVDDETLKRVLEVKNIFVSETKVGSAQNSLENVGSYMWDDSVLFFSMNHPDGGPGFGQEFVWGRTGIDRWREEPRKSDLIRYTRRYDLKYLCVGTSKVDEGKIIGAYLLKDALA